MANFAVVGASGAVGEEILNVLNELDVKVDKLLLLASKRTAGTKVEFRGREITIKELNESSFEGENIDVAFFCAGGSVSEKYAKYAVEAGAVVVDNTSHFRMDKDVPLVVPECNMEDIKDWEKKGIIANPNCSTIQMMHVLKPLDDVFGIKRVNVSTYQASSGAGKEGMEELVNSLSEFFAFRLDEFKPSTFAYPLAFNLIPQIDTFTDSGYTKEELKMVNESKKILHKDFKITATCVRVPVLRSHSESISIEFEKNVDLNKAIEVLKKAPSVVVVDNKDAKTASESDNFDRNDFSSHRYPMPLFTSDTNETYVGRIRKDLDDDNVLHLWCVADQIRVGAATNAVRIAIKWLELNEK